MLLKSLFDGFRETRQNAPLFDDFRQNRSSILREARTASLYTPSRPGPATLSRHELWLLDSGFHQIVKMLTSLAF